MQSSSFSSQPQKARRFDASRPTNNGAGRKSTAPGLQKENKNKNTIKTSSPRQAAIKGPTASTRTRLEVQPRAPLSQPKFRLQKQGATISKTAKPKPKGAQVKVAGQKAPASPPPPPLPNNLPLDPNCNEPSLPCLCCDGRSPQDHNSMFNHNHNNNNTISLRQQMQLPPPPAPLAQRLDGPGAQAQPPSQPQNKLEHSRCSSANVENQKVDERNHQDNKQNIKVEDDDDEESSGDIDIDDDDDSDDEDDDTLVPSCCDCPPSLLEFSLSSSTSSSSTSISSCSDMESDCLDQSASICSSQDQENLCTALSPKDSVSHFSNCQPPARSLPSLPVGLNPFSRPSHSSSSLSSLDEGYPSALDTPSPDYLGVKDVSEVKLGLLDFLESVGEFGKMERFSQIIQVARWDLDAEQHWDVMRDRLDHLDRLEKVHREVKLAYFARLHEKGFDLEDLEEQDLSDVMDEMGNIEIPWKFYKAHKVTMSDSQEFSDAGVDLTAPSDCDDPLPDSLTPSPVEPPARPPKPPVRHASVSSDLHTYINISRETTSMAVTTSPLTTFSPNSTSPTFTTFRCEKPLPPSPPSIPPLPASKQVPYLTLYTTQALTPSLPTPTPPIPPPRRRHLARKEAQRLAALQVEQEKTPLSLPPPTSRPPPLPPPPVISVTFSSPPAIPPPPSLPPPPSFHALDVEIRKLLMLAGLTQAELLKLSPELGVCVDALEDEGLGCIDSGSLETEGFRLQSEEDEDEFNAILTARDKKTEKLVEGQTIEEQQNNQELKEIQRITSFTEMARRKKNTGPICDTYFSTSFSKTHEAETKKINFDTFHYPTEAPDSPPPPPPPRPLPPIPSTALPAKVSTLVANSKQPERFDWLIAFTPECESQPQLPSIEKRKSYIGAPKKLSTSSAAPESAPPPESAPKVTTFKELRLRKKSGSPPTKVITAPEPDPTVITPDPDILYNLKWRKEKADSDGIQWEYTSQAQALFMQPPPALTSMAALQEMLQRADVEGRQPELCPLQKIGSSVSDSSLWTMGREWQSGEIRREETEQEKEEVRGLADGGRTLEMRTTAVRSVSLAGLVQKAETQCEGEDVKHPRRAPSLSAQCLQEKRALVGAVSVAVEAILAQFSSSRTVVQKTLSGDSTINPSLGRLVLQCLCPALHSLLTDGSKPHQSDLIAGRRPNSPWGLVQASTRPGPKTQLLFNLQVRVSELPQLRQSKHRFNAFLLGLLNSKLLDSWLLHLQSCSDVLNTFYLPTSFMRLSLSTCKPMFDELLLVLQPLSLLTFNLDLLFQHHHLEPERHVPQIPAPLCRDSRLKPSPQAPEAKIQVSQFIESLSDVNFGSQSSKAAKEMTVNPKIDETSTMTNGDTAPLKVLATVERTSPQLLWVQEKEMVGLLPPNIEEESLAQQAGQVFQQGWGAVIRWGGRLSQNLSELSLAAVKKEEMIKADQPDSDYTPVSSGTPVPWGWGRLFGATKSPNSPTGPTPPTRRPSQWLAPGVTALTRMVSSSSAPTLRRPYESQRESETESEGRLETEAKPTPPRSVRTLCEHTGTGSELSFCKGEELVVLGGVDQDWIRCRQGDKEGLVPIGYTSLIM
ncbi:uncharacterized protein rusc1 isoform X2 [Gouania willdenowi]|uniref:RUN and SH3 domain-containing protein 1 n=1 Tax=Gouania willdenowi TaxID=441366 RepID=A0A8C5EUJ9_GOUWI|nr:RUN and SH3 domain-containing protein 1 isoform X2 [Gouania willdenowi]